MKDFVLHESTSAALDAFIGSPSQSLILAGPEGSGKFSLAVAVSESILGISDIAAYPYALILKPENGSIGIGTIRQLENFLTLKVPLKRRVSRVIVVKDAHLLTLEAQNALLKTLEEPPAGSLIILTASSLKAVLPTILSRSPHINIKRPVETDLRDLFAREGYSTQQVGSAYFLSGGLPGLMKSLLTESEHPLKPAAEAGRRFLQAAPFERLSMVDELAKQKPLAESMVYVLQQMAALSLQKATGATARRWRAILAASFEAGEELALYAQPKLVLTNLALAI